MCMGDSTQDLHLNIFLRSLIENIGHIFKKNLISAHDKIYDFSVSRRMGFIRNRFISLLTLPIPGKNFDTILH